MIINNYKQHQDIINKLILKEEEKNKSKLNQNNSAINIYSFNNFYLPKIQTSIENNQKENSVSMGFEKIWKEEIFRNGKKVNKMNIKRKLNKLRTNDNTQEYSSIDIFDKNYNKDTNLCDEAREMQRRLNRIKSNNLKVNQILKAHKEMQKKFLDNREYCPNYSSIEKHKPNVNLNTNSQRAFPEKFIKNSIYNDDIVYNIYNDKKIARNNSCLFRNNNGIKKKIFNKITKNIRIDKKKLILNNDNIKNDKNKQIDNGNLFRRTRIDKNLSVG